MVTLVVEERRPLLGRLVGDVRVGLGKEVDSPHVVHSLLGDVVAMAWYTVPHYHPEVEIIALQVMPDHIHGILFEREHLAAGLGMVILGFKTDCNKAYCRLAGVEYVHRCRAAGY